MNIARKEEAKTVKVSNTVTAHEYPLLDKAIHGSVIELSGRYPEQGRVVNETCSELSYAIKGSGRIVIEDEEITFNQFDCCLIIINNQNLLFFTQIIPPLINYLYFLLFSL